MEMLRYAEKRGISYCGWSDDGLSMFIRNPNEFVRQVVPIFFKGGLKFSSFQRKLYRWGFRVVHRFWKRLLGGDEVVVYQADHFQRGRPLLIHHMFSVTATKRKAQSLPKELFSGHFFSFDDGQAQLKATNGAILSRGGNRAQQGDTFPPGNEAHPLHDTEISSADEEGHHERAHTTALAANSRAFDNGSASSATWKNGLISNCSDDDIASLLKLFDLEPSPIIDLSPRLLISQIRPVAIPTHLSHD
jgi:hypothetical protein